MVNGQPQKVTEVMNDESFCAHQQRPATGHYIDCEGECLPTMWHVGQWSEVGKISLPHRIHKLSA